MAYYQELTLIEQPEINSYFIWSKVYTQLHLALVEMKDSAGHCPVGVSFPQYFFDEKQEKSGLGIKLRCFADSEEVLEKLDLSKWLKVLSDYVHITHIRPVPEKAITHYAAYRRIQVKANPERLARRFVKRHTEVSFEEAVAFYKKNISLTKLPFIQLKSLSSDQFFRLFIEKAIIDNKTEGGFSTYGFTLGGSVPEF